MYPAVAVLKELGNKAESVLWVGSEGGMEAGLVSRLGVPYAAIPAAGVHGVGLASLPGNLWKLLRGTVASFKILRKFKPDVLLFTGGFVAVPMAVAGQNIPNLLYVPDIEPGMALKYLARFADCIALTAAPSRSYFSQEARMVITGYPTRPELKGWEKAEARQKLGLQADLPVLLAFGGSKGARSINRAAKAILPELLSEMQILHITGELDWDEIESARAELPAEQAERYHIFPYLHEEMGAAFSAADLAVSRAGASTLGEFPLYGLPAVLVPYPYAWRYQKVNADYLVEHGAAQLLKDEALNSELLATIRGLMQSPDELKKMSQAMKNLAAPRAAQRLAELVCELAGQKSPHSGGESC